MPAQVRPHRPATPRSRRLRAIRSTTVQRAPIVKTLALGVSTIVIMTIRRRTFGPSDCGVSRKGLVRTLDWNLRDFAATAVRSRSAVYTLLISLRADFIGY